MTKVMTCPDPVCTEILIYIKTQILKGGRARYYKCPDCGANIRIIR